MKSAASGKIHRREELLKVVAGWRERGETVAFTNGVFDILHCGHLASIEKAAEVADRLIVGVNSDASARRLGKGAGRPLYPERERALLVAALQAVDAVTLFDEDTPEELVGAIEPDVLVKGGDYRPEEVAGGSSAGRVVIVKLMPGRSTSEIIRRIRSLPEEGDV